MVHHDLRLQDKVKDLEHEVRDLKEYERWASGLKSEVKEVRRKMPP